MATALALSWRNFSDAIDVANPVEKIGRFSPGIGYNGFMGLFSFMLISIPRAISVSIPKISGNPISWSATTYRIAVVGVLPKSAEVNKGTCSQRIGNTRPVTGSENSMSGPCTGSNTHFAHFTIVSRTSEIAKLVEKLASSANLLISSCLITLFSILHGLEFGVD